MEGNAGSGGDPAFLFRLETFEKLIDFLQNNSITSLGEVLSQNILNNYISNSGEFEEYALMAFISTFSIPDAIIQELNQFELGSDDWVEVLNVEYPGEGWQKAWNRVTTQEKELAKEHPLAALIIYSNKSKAENIALTRFPNLPQHNDKADAFRHAFFKALNAQNIRLEIVEAFGTAHESETSPDFILEVEMDLYNNTVGRIRGNQNYQKNDAELADIIENELILGGLNI